MHLPIAIYMMLCNNGCIRKTKGNKMKDRKYYGIWMRQLNEVEEDIQRLNAGRFSWYVPNFYYSSTDEAGILKEAVQLKNRLERDIARLE